SNRKGRNGKSITLRVPLGTLVYDAETGVLLADMARWAMIFGGARSDDREGSNPLVYLLVMIVAPIAAMLIQLAISRAREYEADATGARLAGSPDGLISALRKLEQ
ncbi:MAG: hypothetical protein CUN48_19475, partial [Candidatus Thermofonsia Clade 3 bacterium]